MKKMITTIIVALVLIIGAEAQARSVTVAATGRRGGVVITNDRCGTTVGVAVNTRHGSVGVVVGDGGCHGRPIYHRGVRNPYRGWRQTR